MRSSAHAYFEATSGCMPCFLRQTGVTLSNSSMQLELSSVGYSQSLWHPGKIVEPRQGSRLRLKQGNRSTVAVVNYGI